MGPTDAPTPTQPAQPPGWYPDPSGSGQRYWNGTQWTAVGAPPPPSKGGSKGARVGVIATLAGLLIVGAVVFFAWVQPRGDAKDVLRDARPLVQRSLTVSGRARRDVVRFMRTGDASVRRRAVSELNQMISMRQRAINRLAAMNDISFPGDDNYKNGAKVWASTMRGSIKTARGLRASLPESISTGVLEQRADATFVVTQSLYLARYDRLIRRTDQQIIDDLD